MGFGRKADILKEMTLFETARSRGRSRQVRKDPSNRQETAPHETPIPRISVPILTVVLMAATGCESTGQEAGPSRNADLHTVFDEWYQAWLVLNPVEATSLGVHDYDHLFANDISADHRAAVRQLSHETLASLRGFDTAGLSADDRLNRDILAWTLETTLRMLDQPDHLMPINQMFSNHLEFAQLGSGAGAHPFEEPKDFENFIGRMRGFSRWADTAIGHMEEGIEHGFVLPRAVVLRVIPQLQSVAETDAEGSMFARPLDKLDDLEGNQSELRRRFLNEIDTTVLPAYRRLHTFFRETYLPAARSTDGIGSLPDGDVTLSGVYPLLDHNRPGACAHP